MDKNEEYLSKSEDEEEEKQDEEEEEDPDYANSDENDYPPNIFEEESSDQNTDGLNFE